MNEENIKRRESLTDSFSALTQEELAEVIWFTELVKNSELYELKKREAANQDISVYEYVDKEYKKKHGVML